MKYYLLTFICGFFTILNGSTVQVDRPLIASNARIEVCEEPLSWRFGEIDSRFNIDKQTIRDLMDDVSDMWSDAVDKKMLVYRDSGEVVLNFIYGDAQKFTENEEQLSNRMNRMKLYYYSLITVYEERSREHHKLLSRYNTLSTEYQQKMEEHHRAESRWNKEVATTSTDEQYREKRESEIDELKAKVDRTLNKLNSASEKMNESSKLINSYADQVNKVIYTYKELFNNDKTFHQGFYIKAGGHQKINIYQFDNIDKLRLVLAHEVGHALGLKHTDNPESIMYYKMERQKERNLHLTQEDIRAIQNKCRD